MQMTPAGPVIPPPPASVPVVSTSMVAASGRMETRRRSSTQPDATPLKKKYKCVKCSHLPFLTKYGLAEHINIKHQSKGVACDICGNLMSWPENQDILFFIFLYISQTLQMNWISFMAFLLNAVL